MHHAYTMYFDPLQGILHTITSEVKEDGTHTVVRSDISSCSMRQWPITVSWAKRQWGEAYIRAYTITAF